MGPLAAVERFLEQLFERQSARLFRTGIRPVVILRRLERAMEDGRVREGPRTVVPHRLIVRLEPDVLAGLRASTPELAATLADGALAFARHHGYTLLDRPIVTIRPDPAVQPTDVQVDADGTSFDSDPAGPGAPLDPNPPAPQPAPRRIEGRPPVSDATADTTSLFVVPGADGPRASLREVRPDGTTRTIAFEGRPVTIGRATDNAIVLRDGCASRHHARIDARRGSLVLTDLGSTNGSFVNDRRVESVALGEGDRIRLGATILLVETIDDAVSDGDAARTGAAAARAAPGG